jgi:hypothetical protein
MLNTFPEIVTVRGTCCHGEVDLKTSSVAFGFPDKNLGSGSVKLLLLWVVPSRIVGKRFTYAL